MLHPNKRNMPKVEPPMPPDHSLQETNFPAWQQADRDYKEKLSHYNEQQRFRHMHPEQVAPEEAPEPEPEPLLDEEEVDEAEADSADTTAKPKLRLKKKK